MPSPFEAEIHCLLRENPDLKQVADELVRRWELSILSLDEQADVAQFLLACGFGTTLAQNLQRLTLDDKRLPWTQLAELIGQSQIAVGDDELTAILEGAQEQNAIEDLTRSHALDRLHTDLEVFRGQVLRGKRLAFDERRQALRDKLSFMKANRLFEEEAKVLAEALEQFPDDREFRQARDSFDIRWAREIVQNSTTVVDPTQDLEWKAARLEPEQMSAKNFIVTRAKELSEKDPKLAYDLAVTLHFMDFNTEAIEVLRNAQGSPSADWLRLELMLQARQFVTVLDEANLLESRYAGDPETTFAVIYARARALRGLGQNTMATDLLRSLVRIRPNYKSAHSLLMDWTGGDL